MRTVSRILSCAWPPRSRSSGQSIARWIASAVLVSVAASAGCERGDAAGDASFQKDDAASLEAARDDEISTGDEPDRLEDAARECSNANDCVDVEYYAAVTSKADCYCPVCPSDYGRFRPASRVVEAARRQQWTRICSDWNEDAGCSLGPCPQAPAVACNSGTCAFGKPDLPVPMTD